MSTNNHLSSRSSCNTKLTRIQEYKSEVHFYEETTPLVTPRLIYNRQLLICQNENTLTRTRFFLFDDEDENE
jgi:hypothetical protein